MSARAEKLTTIDTGQKTYQPLVSIKNPPTIGPMTGPSNGPRELRDIAVPLLSTGIISAIVPLPQVIVPTPATAARNRKVINIPILGATAEVIMKIRNSILHVLYMEIRP